MKNRIQKIIKSLSETFEGEPWYGESIMRKLENVPYVIGYQSCNPESHSVAQIIGHLIAWKKYAIAKIKGNEDACIEINSKDDWPDIRVNSQQEWEELKRELVAAQSKIYELLNEQQEDSFLDQIVAGKNYDFEHLLVGVTQHDIYHIGQIGLIESQLKEKEVDAGVFKN